MIEKLIWDWYWVWAETTIGTYTLAEAFAFVFGLFLSTWRLWLILGFLGLAGYLAGGFEDEWL